MWKEILRDVLIIAALISQIVAMVITLDQGVDGFEASVTFSLAAILCLLWAQTHVMVNALEE